MPEWLDKLLGKKSPPEKQTVVDTEQELEPEKLYKLYDIVGEIPIEDSGISVVLSRLNWAKVPKGVPQSAKEASIPHYTIFLKFPSPDDATKFLNKFEGKPQRIQENGTVIMTQGIPGEYVLAQQHLSSFEGFLSEQGIHFPKELVWQKMRDDIEKHSPKHSASDETKTARRAIPPRAGDKPPGLRFVHGDEDTERSAER